MFKLAFFNYLSIVEICIDKSPSGGDLLYSSAISKEEPPPPQRLDRSACRTQLRGDGTGACGPKRGELKAPSSGGNRWGRLAFDLRETRRASGGSIGLLKPRDQAVRPDTGYDTLGA